MLPPHRPFREKPAPKVAIKKKTAAKAPVISIDSHRHKKRRNLKPELAVLDHHSEAVTR
jgi:hypothetical protein